MSRYRAGTADQSGYDSDRADLLTTIRGLTQRIQSLENTGAKRPTSGTTIQQTTTIVSGGGGSSVSASDRAWWNTGGALTEVALNNTTDVGADGNYCILTLTSNHTFVLPTVNSTILGRPIRYRLDSGAFIATLSAASGQKVFWSSDSTGQSSWLLGPQPQDVLFIAVIVGGVYGWRVADRYPYYRPIVVSTTSSPQPGDHIRVATGTRVVLSFLPDASLCLGDRVLLEVISGTGGLRPSPVSGQSIFQPFGIPTGISGAPYQFYPIGSLIELEAAVQANGTTFGWDIISNYRAGVSADFSPIISTQSGTTYTALSTDDVVIFTSTSACTLTLPAASAYSGKILRAHKATTGNLTVTRAGSDTINGATSVTSTTATGASISVFSDGAAWYLVVQV